MIQASLGGGRALDVRSPMISKRFRGPVVIVALVLLAAYAASRAPPLAAPTNAPLGAEPRRIMGTRSRLLAIPPGAQPAALANATASRALRKAEATLRAVEAEMSVHLHDSPLSRLNRSPAGQRTPLPPDLMTVLRASAEAWHATAGAFDITCRPLAKLWKEAERQDEPPARERLAEVRERSSWKNLTLDADGATRRTAGLEVDVGGIAKGYAIDLAVQRMLAAGVSGGLVDVGGDLRVFGSPPDGGRWEVQIQNPSGKGSIARLRLRAGAVCTSGDYFRFFEVAGRRFSHILDPRTGYPVRTARSATVVAPDATSADVWATALSVLGPEGLSRLPANHEAMLIVGEPVYVTVTKGFMDMLATELPYPLTLADR